MNGRRAKLIRAEAAAYYAKAGIERDDGKYYRLARSGAIVRDAARRSYLRLKVLWAMIPRPSRTPALASRKCGFNVPLIRQQGFAVVDDFMADGQKVVHGGVFDAYEP